MSLYHYQLGIPANAQTRFGVLSLEYSEHALREARRDKYGWARLPEVLNTSAMDCQVIELETDNYGMTEKVVYRVPYDEKRDLILVVIPHRDFVKTVWFNEKSDGHTTLDASKYDPVTTHSS